MEDLKPLLIDRLKSKGIDLSLIPAFLKALKSIIATEPGIETRSGFITYLKAYNPL